MAITVGNVAAGSTGSPAASPQNVTPAFPTGYAAGDVTLYGVLINGGNTGIPKSVATPAGYTKLVEITTAAAANIDPKFYIFARDWQSGDAAPTFAITGSTVAASYVIRGLRLRGSASVASLLDTIPATLTTNASAANIGPVAGLIPGTDGCIVMVFGQRQRGWTGVAQLTGFTEAFDNATGTAAGTSGMVMDYVIQTTAAAVANQTFVVSGGAAATGSGFMVSLAPPPAGPAGVGGATAWFKADAITGLSNGDPVSTWPDSSGNGYDATGGTAPTYVTGAMNGLPVVRFTPGDRLPVRPWSTIAPASQYTILAVARVASTGSQANVWENAAVAQDADGYGGLLFRDSSGTLQAVAYAWDGAAKTAATATPGYNTSFQVTSDLDGSTLRVRVNGGSATSTASGVMQSLAGTVLLGSGTIAGNSLDGDLAEAIIYDRVLTDGERASVEAYLAAKWLPSTVGLDRAASESLSLSDAAAQTAAFARNTAESLSLSDVAAQSPLYARTASEALTLDDGASRSAQTFIRAASDPLTLSDVAVVSAIHTSLSASESLMLSDAASGAVGGNLSRSASESLSLTDAATAGVELSRTAAEELVLSDSASTDGGEGGAMSGNLMLMGVGGGGAGGSDGNATRYGVNNIAGWSAHDSITNATAIGVGWDRQDVGIDTDIVWNVGSGTAAQMFDLIGSNSLRVLPVIWWNASNDMSTISSTDFGNALVAWVQEYGPGGTYWQTRDPADRWLAPDVLELFNEPHGSWFWTNPSATEFARLVQAGRAAIEAAGLGSTVKLIAPCDQMRAPTFYDAAKAAGAYTGLDGVALHPYGRVEAVGYLDGWVDGDIIGTFEEQVAEVKATLPGVPLWITEVGQNRGADESNSRQVSQQYVDDATAVYVAAAKADPLVEALWIFNYAGDYGVHDTAVSPYTELSSWQVLAGALA